MPEQFSNAAQSTLAANVGPTDTTLTVVSAAGFPTSGNFRLLIDQEILLVTSVSGNVFTVTRAVEAVNGVQAAQGHGLGALVTSPLTVAALANYPLPGSGTVTSVGTSSPLTGGPITGAGTIGVAASGVTPGTYGDASNVGQFTVDTYGRITSAANVAISAGGGMVIGNPVSGGAINQVLFVDASGNLGQNQNLTYTVSILQLALVGQGAGGSALLVLSDGTAHFEANIGQFSGTAGQALQGKDNTATVQGDLAYNDGTNPSCGVHGKDSSVDVRLADQSGSLFTSTGVTDGTATFTGTLGNAPATGDPAGWLKVTVNGGTHYIPYW